MTVAERTHLVEYYSIGRTVTAHSEVDGIPTANYGNHSRGFFSVKDDSPEFDKDKPVDEEGFMHVSGTFSYAAHYAAGDKFLMRSGEQPGCVLYEVEYDKVDPYIPGLPCPA